MKLFGILFLFVFIRPLFADVTIINISNDYQVLSPFALRATAGSCQGQTPAQIGYLFDSGPPTIISGSTLDTQISAPSLGPHTLTVESFGPNNTVCKQSVVITATAGPIADVPTNAAVTNIQSNPNWNERFDPGTITDPGTIASGTTQIVSSPSLSGQARKFQFQYTDNGGELFYDSFGSDPTSTNFIYDTWIYVASPATDIVNVELDMNQVIANGDTIIYAFQCDGWHQTWDYTNNIGTLTQTQAHWNYSSAYCDPRTWSTDVWHHIQIVYTRNDMGYVTYQMVWLDNIGAPINEKVWSEFSLGWSSVLLVNFQLDGIGLSGSGIAYLDRTTVYHWQSPQPDPPVLDTAVVQPK